MTLSYLAPYQSFMWSAYWFITPRISLFGDEGLLRFARDLLVMAVPFMVGALASVAMGGPGPHLEKRPRGADLSLDGKQLTLRQFVCYLLGYLSFVGLVTLGAVVAAALLHDSIVHWIATRPDIPMLGTATHVVGSFALSVLLSVLAVTVFLGTLFSDLYCQRS